MTERKGMIDAGYFLKRVEQKPEGLHVPGVREIRSASHCISSAPENWIGAWLHNDLGWFNRIGDASSAVRSEHRADFRLFAYRILPEAFTAVGRLAIPLPENVRPEPIGPEFRSLGFDSVNKSMDSVLGSC